MVDEIIDKMGRIRALSDAIERQKENLRNEKTYDNAVALQQLQAQRRELQSTLPKLQVVN